MEASGIGVLLVEDDEDLRDSVVEWLELAGMRVKAADSAAGFYQLLPNGDYQVAVIDVGLPDQSGYVLAQYIRANTDLAVIMLTARSAVEDKIKGYDSGADLYLVKPVDCRELSAAILSIAQRVRKPAAETLATETPVTEAPATERLWTISAAHWQLHVAGDEKISLSAKELKFLELLAATPGQPVLRTTVLTELYQRHDYYTGRSLDSLVRRLRAKVASQTGITIPIRTVHAVGYSFVGAIAVS
ncbi:DNA-binding response OmpR family regulator [Herbaspirillum sp. Sphag1AN]|uniref:response regulator transcription factor n=1 Tax=unclassified Herbaspirillum TaxID=2624150 RepID=UPI00161DB92A|nr:DNA-binding response OmpR family regulator [Herbaspirillum sp. Sphag1AN]MBB3246272.1 DNA-binding response OmpR family regulator [Herbaspirillum sp. Sphag64]